MERREFLRLSGGKGTPPEYQAALGQTGTQVHAISPGDALTF